jgi:hypothetical protein
MLYFYRLLALVYHVLNSILSKGLIEILDTNSSCGFYQELLMFELVSVSFF